PDEESVAGRRERLVIVGLHLENFGNKTIAEVEGAVLFSDVYDRDLFECPILIHEPLLGGASLDRMESLTCAPAMEEEARVRQARLADTKVRWEPRRILFEDGSVLTTPD